MDAPLPPYVSAVAPGVWTLEEAQSLIPQLGKLPVAISNEGSRIVLRHSPDGDEVSARIGDELRKLGFHFADGRDWSPKAYMLYLRDKGLISGAFREIYWTKPGAAHAAEV